MNILRNKRNEKPCSKFLHMIRSQLSHCLVLIICAMNLTNNNSEQPSLPYHLKLILTRNLKEALKPSFYFGQNEPSFVVKNNNNNK